MLKYLALIIFTVVRLNAQQPVIPSQIGTAPAAQEGTLSNVLNYGAAVSSAFDDNAVNSNLQGTTTNVTTSIQPQASLTIARPRLTSTFFYTPGFTYSNNIAGYNSTSQVAGTSIKYSFTKRLAVDLKEGFTHSANPLINVQAATELPNPGILAHPNASTFGADVVSSTNETQGDLVYLLDAHTSIGVGGTFTKLRYRSDSDVNSFSQASRGWTGNAFYSHELTSTYSFGVQYAARHFSSASTLGQFSSLSHQTLGFFNISLKPAITISAFAGPEISEINDKIMVGLTPISGQLSRSSLAAGTSVNWRGEHNGLNASFVQQVSDSGAVGGGAVAARTLSLEIQHQLTKLSNISLNGSYTSNSQLDPLSVIPLVNSGTIGIRFSRSLSQRLAFQASALRQQFTGTIPVGFFERSHDIMSATLTYSWQMPIGR